MQAKGDKYFGYVSGNRHIQSSAYDYKMGRQKTLSAEILSKIAEYFSVTVDYLLGAPVTPADEQSLKVALFGGDTFVTDDMWNEVKRYAEFIKERKNGDKKTV